MKLFFILIHYLTFFFGTNPKIEVDAIYYNAHVVTVDSSFTMAEAFAIKNGKFVGVGKSKDILEKYESKIKIDVDGKYIYPGFIDAHSHFTGYATDLSKCQLTGAKSFSEVLNRVSQYNNEQNPSFIFGRGWDQNIWDVKEFPNSAELDKLFPRKPVFLERIDGHAALVNKAFLQLADSILQPYYNTNYVEMKDDVPTGILFDNAMDEAEKLIPALPSREMIKAMMKAQENCFKVGLTSVTDAGISPKQIVFIDSLQRVNLLKLRIYAMVAATHENVNYFESNGKIKTDYLNVRSLKVYADGALGSRGAKLKQDYTDKPGFSGEINTTEKDFYRYADWAMRNNFQLNTHAIGDSANKYVLDLYEEYLKGKNNLRWRIEHAQIVDMNDINQFGENAVVPSVQPTHATSDMGWAEDRLGPYRMAGAYAYKSLLLQNGWIPLGTDFPVEYINPQYTFYAAVSRRDAAGKPVEGFNIKEALTREEALRGMTIWAAKAAFEEKEKGSIEAGKFADFIIYKQNFLTDDLLQIRNSTPLKTFVNGVEMNSGN